MSEESDFSDHASLTWIQWFVALDEHGFLAEINPDFIRQPFNLYAIDRSVRNFEEAYQMILRPNAPQQFEIQDKKFLELFQSAKELYGLIHARYITTPEGLAIMRQKYLSGKFEHCPRVLCEKQNTLPIGLSEQCKIARVKIYCPRCKDIYSTKKRSLDLDGAFFGASFPHLLLMTYPDIGPEFERVEYIPTVYGFKLEEQSEQSDKKEQNHVINDQPMLQKSENEATKPKKKKKQRN